MDGLSNPRTRGDRKRTKGDGQGYTDGRKDTDGLSNPRTETISRTQEHGHPETGQKDMNGETQTDGRTGMNRRKRTVTREQEHGQTETGRKDMDGQIQTDDGTAHGQTEKDNQNTDRQKQTDEEHGRHGQTQKVDKQQQTDGGTRIWTVS